MLVLSIDTWRADFLGAREGGPSPTPNLDRLVAGGGLAATIQSVAPQTTPSHATLLTGLYPARHGIRDNFRGGLAAGVATLPERLRAAGWVTAAFVSAEPLSRRHGLDRGFEVYDDRGFDDRPSPLLTPAERPAVETVDAALAWLERREPSDSRDLFLFVHVYEPHLPYQPPPPFASRFAGSPYAGEVAAADDQAGRLFDRLRSLFPGRLNVLATSDHGEGLGEHGESGHGVFLYQTTMAVPLVLYPKPERPLRLGRPWSLVDVAATLAEIAGIDPWPMDGRSLFAAGRSRWVYGESRYPLLFGVRPGVSMVSASHSWISEATEMVHDLRRDPRQERPLAARAARPVAAEASAALRELTRSEGERGTGDGPTAEEVARLRALGYLGGGRAPESSRAVPFARLARSLEVLGRAREAVAAGRAAEALPKLEAVVAELPQAQLAWQLLGSARAEVGQVEAAAAAFGRAVALDEADPVSWLGLGNIRLLKGDAAGAIDCYRRSLRADADQPEANLNLARAWLEMGQPAEAAVHLRRFLELAPEDPEAASMKELLRRIEKEPTR